jgi:hypothetical protein
MEERQLDPCYGRWYQSFLYNRRYRVRYGEVVSGFCRFANGVPQGSVSGSLLFIIYTDTLSRRLYELHGEVGLNHHLFADDNTLWKLSPDLEVCAIAIQQGLDIVEDWSHEYKIPVSVGKNEGLLFTNSPVDRDKLREITLGEDVIVFTPKARLLGVILDTKIRFGPHVDKLKSDVGGRLVQMRAIQGSDWGGNSKDSRGLYVAYIRIKLKYGGPAFFPL